MKPKPAGSANAGGPAPSGSKKPKQEVDPEQRKAEEERNKVMHKAIVAKAMQALLDRMLDLDARGEFEGDALAAVVDDLGALREAIKGVADAPSRRNLEATLKVLESNLPEGTLATKSSKYTDPSFWEEYYGGAAPEERYDWLLSHGGAISAVELPAAWRRADGERAAPPATFGALLRELMGGPGTELLMVGCGHSDLSEDLYQDGYTRFTNIDISGHVVETMRSQLHEKLPGMRWLQMNASRMEFEDASFDAVLDKATVDALAGDKALASATLLEAHRVLRPGGVFVMTSLFAPEKNLVMETRDVVGWQDCLTLTITADAYVYACARA